MTSTGVTERCHRCLQPVPLNARRCPHCGDFQKVSSRKLTLYLAVLGILAIFAMVAVSLFLKPAVVDEGNIPASEREKSAPPPKPMKKPPLN
jgi:hypothetical protein